ncbi:integrase, catalytic region, zinc finger, CCHC-type containing protein [Tanacetum coccineum]|uniref:Integrase, catalytic region, zinc finger, CCHC-type containing protein n=1 Tax=Tanacetum coccineum TaxID=301880 RepID=A0ABQ5I8W5_9ASTR
MQQPPPNNNYNPQPSFNKNYMQQPMPNPEDLIDPTTTMNMALVTQPGMNMGQDRQMQMVRGNDRNKFGQYAGQIAGNQNGYNPVQNVGNQNPNGNGNVVAARAEGNANGNNGNQIRCYNCRGLGHLARNCTVKPRRRDAAYLQTQLLIAQKEEAGIQLQAEEFDLMAVAADLDEIEEVNANCILMANLQQASTSGTQTDRAPVYDSDGSAEVLHYNNCYNNDIFNMFTQEEQYTKLLEPILEPHQVQQNDSNVIYEVSCMEQSGGTIDQHLATVEETHAYIESVYINLANEVEKRKQQSLYNGKVLLEKHDPPAVHDSEETLQLAQESRQKMKQLNKEIKPAKLTKINHLSVIFVLKETAKSQEEVCDSDLEVALRGTQCFGFRESRWVMILLKGNRSTNLYTINLHEMASASPICLMARATSTKTSLSPPVIKEKAKRASHPTQRPVPNLSKLTPSSMDLCGPMRIASINGKRYVLVICRTLLLVTLGVHFLRSKDEAPEVIKTLTKANLLSPPSVSCHHHKNR